MGNTSLSQYQIGNTIGSGAYGTVYKAERKSDSRTFAIKTVKLEKLTPLLLEKTLNQVRLLASIQHPNIIGFESSYYSHQDNTLCIVTEFASKGDLANKIKVHKSSSRRIPESTIWKILLHISRDGTFKIGDLNLSKVLRDKLATKTQLGTPLYISPQIWKNQSYGTQSDIWSLGVLAYELATLKTPFDARTTKELREKVFSNKPSRIPFVYTQQLTNIIDKLLTIDPLVRPNADELVELCNDALSRYYPENLVELQQQPIDLLRTIILPTDKGKWNVILPQKPRLKNSQLRYSSCDVVRRKKSAFSGDEEQSTKENLSNVSTKDKAGRAESAIQKCQKGKKKTGRVQPLLQIIQSDKENIDTNNIGQGIILELRKGT